MTDKNFSQDVVPSTQKRSIRDIPVPPRKRTVSSRVASDVKQSVKSEIRSSVDINQSTQPIQPSQHINRVHHMNDLNGENYSKSKKIKIYGIFAGIILFLIAIFIIFSAFDSAVINLEPKTVSASINKTINVADISNKTDSKTVGYRTIELSKTVSKEIKAEKEEFVQSKASGTITIFNEYSDKPQTLIKNTRFESSNGSIYRIQESVTVPGYTESNGKKIAGTLDATVLADVAGEKYNLDSAEFTIPGFKGQDPYEFFYAKTKTAITGGYDGIRKIVAPEEIQKTSIELQATLKDELVKELSGQISNEFLAIYNDSSFTFEPIKQTDNPDGKSVTLSLSGQIKSKVINKVELSNAIARDTIIDYRENHNILATNLSEINLQITKTNDSDPVEIITINNNLNFVWQIDVEGFKKALVNKPKKEFGLVVSQFSGIENGNVVVKPFWRNIFPDDVSNIEIELLEK